jgi:hypothetical protein
VFSYISPEQRVRKVHPLRPIRAMVDRVLKELSPEFDKMYSQVGRPSIPPEQLLRALLLQMLYSVRSERLLVEEIDYNILFRWFVGLNLDGKVLSSAVRIVANAASVVHSQSHARGDSIHSNRRVRRSLPPSYIASRSTQHLKPSDHIPLYPASQLSHSISLFGQYTYPRQRS